MAGVPLHTAEHAPDAGDGGHLVSQHPFPADSQLAAPLAVLFQILIHHGKELLDRGGLLRIGELIPDGLGQGALFRVQGVPQAPVGQKEPHQNRSGPRHGDQVIAEADLLLEPLRLIGHGLGHREEPDGQTAAHGQESGRDQSGQPPPGALEAVALLRAVGLLPPVPPHNQEDQGDGKDAQRYHQKYVDDDIPGPFEIKALFGRFLQLHDIDPSVFQNDGIPLRRVTRGTAPSY